MSQQKYSANKVHGAKADHEQAQLKIMLHYKRRHCLRILRAKNHFIEIEHNRYDRPHSIAHNNKSRKNDQRDGDRPDGHGVRGAER